MNELRINVLSDIAKHARLVYYSTVAFSLAILLAVAGQRPESSAIKELDRVMAFFGDQDGELRTWRFIEETLNTSNASSSGTLHVEFAEPSGRRFTATLPRIVVFDSDGDVINESANGRPYLKTPVAHNNLGDVQRFWDKFGKIYAVRIRKLPPVTSISIRYPEDRLAGTGEVQSSNKIKWSISPVGKVSEPHVSLAVGVTRRFRGFPQSLETYCIASREEWAPLLGYDLSPNPYIMITILIDDLQLDITEIDVLQQINAPTSNGRFEVFSAAFPVITTDDVVDREKNLAQLRAAIKRAEGPEPPLKVLGLEVRDDQLAIWAPVLALGLVGYSVLNVRRLVGLQVKWRVECPVAWIALYPERMPRFVYVITQSILPLVVCVVIALRVGSWFTWVYVLVIAVEGFAIFWLTRDLARNNEDLLMRDQPS